MLDGSNALWSHVFMQKFHIRHVPTTRSIFKSMKDLSPNPTTSDLRLLRYIRSESSSFLYFHIAEELGFIVLDSRSKCTLVVSNYWSVVCPMMQVNLYTPT